MHLDVPKIDVIWTGIADPHTPIGAHGIGEIGITGAAAAVANAGIHGLTAAMIVAAAIPLIIKAT